MSVNGDGRSDCPSPLTRGRNEMTLHEQQLARLQLKMIRQCNFLCLWLVWLRVIENYVMRKHDDMGFWASFELPLADFKGI